MKRVLIVSPYFPPSGLAAVHRARHLVKHLPAHGWMPTVVCVDSREYEQRLDPSLAAFVPDDARIVRVGAFPKRVARAVGLGDVSIRAFRTIGRALDRLIREEGADALLVTMSPFYPALIGAAIARRHRRPLVLDYQDPWIPATPPAATRLSKARLSYDLARLLEPRALAAATRVTAVSEGTNEMLHARYPGLDRGRFSAHPIGVDPHDFSVHADAPHAARMSARADQIVVTYVGTIWPTVLPTLCAIFSAVASLKHEAPRLYDRLQLRFVGTSYGPAGTARPQTLALAAEAGVADRVSEVPERVAYNDALRSLVDADVILAFGSQEPHYAASKIFSCLLAGPPVLGFFHEQSSVCDVMRRVGNCKLVTFSGATPPAAHTRDFAAALRLIVEEPARLPPADRAAMHPFTAYEVARDFAHVLDRALHERPLGATA